MTSPVRRRLFAENCCRTPLQRVVWNHFSNFRCLQSKIVLPFMSTEMPRQHDTLPLFQDGKEYGRRRLPLTSWALERSRVAVLEPRLCASGEETRQTDHLSLKCSSLMKTVIPTSERCENKLHSPTKTSIISLGIDVVVVVVIILLLIIYHCD